MMRRYALLVLSPLLAGLVWLVWMSAGVAQVSSEIDRAVDGIGSPLLGPLPHFLLQLVVVLSLAKSAGVLMRRLGQPAVIGEMLAGILLGPSLLGWVLPQTQAWLFPSSGSAALGHVAQLGVLVFLFSAGAEFELSRLRGQRRTALLIAHTGIAFPFVLGLLLACPLFTEYAPTGTDFVGFALFLGVALSVTAFPVLLRIIEERGYRRLPIATLAIACAVISDASAWAILGAIVVWTQRGEPALLVVHLGLLALLVWGLLSVLRPGLSRLEVGESSPRAMIAILLLVVVCALATEMIGLHLLFGAFLGGLAVSGSSSLRHIVEQRIEPFAVVLLLPLFFASTGLAIRIDLLDSGEWLWCLTITGIATLGKFGGTLLAARWCGVGGPDAWRLSALMNTRGLMELIVLALGYELRLIDERLYAMLVLVAIVTTVLTGPTLTWVDRREQRLAHSATAATST